MKEQKTEKKKYPFVGFRPAADVRRMLIKADKAGANVSKLCNISLRGLLISRGFAGKKDLTSV